MEMYSLTTSWFNQQENLIIRNGRKRYMLRERCPVPLKSMDSVREEHTATFPDTVILSPLPVKKYKKKRDHKNGMF